jgi:hypothetical protein
MLEVGKKYTAKNGHEFECIVVTDTHAWMKGNDHATAYVWSRDGKCVSLGSEYDIKPAAREYWIYANRGENWKVRYIKPPCVWDEVIHVREVLE